jgi:hypothetical protein
MVKIAHPSVVMVGSAAIKNRSMWMQKLTTTHVIILVVVTVLFAVK